MSTDKSVIVIGAGAAGVAAATRLYERGMKNVTILEAQDRIGGRVHSVDLGEHGSIDLGAQWVHGEKGNVVYEMAQPRGLLTYSSEKKKTFVRSFGDIVPDNVSNKAYGIFNKFLFSDQSETAIPEGSISTGTYLTNLWNMELENDTIISTDLKASFLEWFHQASNSVDGSDSWFDCAASNHVEYAKCPGDQLVNWSKGGYATIFNLLLEKVNALTSGDFVKNNIKLNHKVIFIEWNNNDDDKITAVCENDASFKADHIIITVSLAVLKRIHKELFKFKLPQFKIDAIEGLGIGTVDKIFVFFPHRWWPDDTESFSLLWKADDKKAYEEKGLGWLTDIFMFRTVNSAPNALLGWIIGESARKMEMIPESELKLLLIDLLRKFFAAHYKIPDITMLIRSTWHTNSNVRGSYSYRSLLTEKLQTSSSKLAMPIENNKGIPAVLFAGEATNQHHYSTVHGAVETGWNQAENVLKVYAKSP